MFFFTLSLKAKHTDVQPKQKNTSHAHYRAMIPLQNVLSEEFKASEIEVGVVRDEGDRSFRVLSNEEVEGFLTAISERD